MALFLDPKYQDYESRQIAELGVATGQEGAAWAHIVRRRGVEAFRRYLRQEKAFRRAVFRKPKWCSAL